MRTSRALRRGWSVQLRWSLQVSSSVSASTVRPRKPRGEPSEAGGGWVSVSTHWLSDRLCARVYGSVMSVCELAVVHDGRTCCVGEEVKVGHVANGRGGVEPGSTATARDFAGIGLHRVVLYPLNCPYYS